MDDFIVTYLTGRVDIPKGDPHIEGKPYKVYVNMRPPEFMEVTWALMYGGSEEVVAWAKDRAAVDLFLDKGELRDHPRLRRIEITAPDGTVERIQA